MTDTENPHVQPRFEKTPPLLKLKLKQNLNLVNIHQLSFEKMASDCVKWVCVFIRHYKFLEDIIILIMSTPLTSLQLSLRLLLLVLYLE